jgi:hypothetical protein
MHILMRSWISPDRFWRPNKATFLEASFLVHEADQVVSQPVGALRKRMKKKGEGRMTCKIRIRQATLIQIVS